MSHFVRWSLTGISIGGSLLSIHDSMINGAIESAVSKAESAILNQIVKSISFGSVFFFKKIK
jgi:hypothetical protein